MDATNVLVIGAHGQIARVATDLFLDRTNAHLTLYLRDAQRLRQLQGHERVRIVEGDVLEEGILEAAMTGQDVVYANLSGNMGEQARMIVAVMERRGPKRLIFIAFTVWTRVAPCFDGVAGARRCCELQAFVDWRTHCLSGCARAGWKVTASIARASPLTAQRVTEMSKVVESCA